MSKRIISTKHKQDITANIRAVYGWKAPSLDAITRKLNLSEMNALQTLLNDAYRKGWVACQSNIDKNNEIASGKEGLFCMKEEALYQIGERIGVPWQPVHDWEYVINGKRDAKVTGLSAKSWVEYEVIKKSLINPHEKGESLGWIKQDDLIDLKKEGI